MAVYSSPLRKFGFQALPAFDASADDSNFPEGTAYRADKRRKVEAQDVEEYLPMAKPTHISVDVCATEGYASAECMSCLGCGGNGCAYEGTTEPEVL